MSFNASKKDPTSHPRVSATCSFESDEGDADDDLNDASFDQLDSSFSDKRQSRNQNEKKRRDQFNNFIQELGNLLTHPRKIDKATILKESLNFFKNHEDKPQDNNEIDAKFKPPFLQNDEFLRFMIEFQNAFCLVFDLNAQIKYVSDDIIHLMGHFPKAIENRSLYKLIDEKSALQLKNFLKRKFSSADVIDFECKFKRNGIGLNAPSFELVKIKGFFKRSNSSEHFNTLVKLDSFMRINEIYATEINPKTFESELSVDFKFTSLSASATEVIGYSPIEVLGASLYDYCHHDDLDKLVDCHKNLLANGKSGNSRDQLNYRLRTKGQQWVWIRTAFELVHDPVKKRPSSIQCGHQTINIDTSAQQEAGGPSSASSNSNNTGQSSFEDEFSKQGVTPEDLSYEKPSSTASSTYDKQSSSSSSNYDKSVSSSDLCQDKQDLRRYGTDEQSETSANFKSPDGGRQMSSHPPSYEPKKSNKMDQEEADESVVTSKPNKQLDEGLATFLESCTNSSYRSFVLEQFQKKKFSIVSAIQERQDELTKLKDELKVIEDTVENIIDEKKLKSWLMEFHNQKALQQNASTANNPDNNSKNAKRRILDSTPTDGNASPANYNNMSYDQSSSYNTTTTTTTGDNNKPTTSSQAQDFSNNNTDSIQLGSYFRSTQMETPSYNLFSKQPAGYLPDSSKSDPNARIKKINLSKRGGTHIPAPPDSSFNTLMSSNEELTTSKLVGDLISLRSSLPGGSSGMSYSTADEADFSTPTSAQNMNFNMENGFK